VQYGVRMTVSAAVASCVFAGVAFAARLPTTTTAYDLRGARIYDDLCVRQETGDLKGLRVFVRPHGRIPRILYQRAEGGLLPPVAAKSWAKDGVLNFEIPGEFGAPGFRSRVDADHLILESSRRGTKPFHLDRRQHIDRVPNC